MRSTPRAYVLAVTILAIAGSAMAQSNDTPQAQPADPAVLAGPKVAPRDVKPSLVERDETGKVRRLDLPPAEAALKLLELDDATKAKTQRILDERSAELDRIVRENLVLLVNLVNAGKSQDTTDQRKYMRELYDRSASLRSRGQLAEELASVMPKEQADKMRALIREYAQAIVAEARASSQSSSGDSMDDAPEPKTAPRSASGRALQVEMANAIGREIKRSYERVVTSRVKDFEALIKELNLTPEQEGEVRRVVTDQFQKTAGNPTPRQRGEAFAQLYALLTKEQREILKSKLDEARK